MANRFDSKKEYAKLAKKAEVVQIVNRMKKLDSDGRDLILKSLNKEMTPVTKNIVMSEFKGLVNQAGDDIKANIETMISTGYIDGMNMGTEWGVKSNPKQITLFKWSNGNKGDINKEINNSFGNATLGDGTYFSLDPVSSQEFGDNLSAYSLSKKSNLYDMTKKGKPTTILEVQNLQIADPMYREYLKSGSKLGFTDWLKTKGYDGAIFFSDGGDGKWVSLNNEVAKTVTPILPDQPKITFEDIKNTPAMQGHLYAVNAMLSDTYTDFGKGFNDFSRGAEKVLNEATRYQVRSEILKGRLEGKSVQKISKNMKTVLQKNNVSVLIDRGGKKWSMEAYSEMLTRTHLIRANNEGIINRANEFGIDIVQVSNHASACPICQQFENEIYSLSGDSKEYPLLTDQPPFHPNCSHRLLMRPDLG